MDRLERRGAWVRRAESAGAVWAMTTMIYRVLQWAHASGGVTRRCITRWIPNVALALPGKNSVITELPSAKLPHCGGQNSK